MEDKVDRMLIHDGVFAESFFKLRTGSARQWIACASECILKRQQILYCIKMYNNKYNLLFVFLYKEAAALWLI